MPPGCARCRQPLPPVGPCRFCADWPDALRWATSAVWLGDEARDIVHHLKYQGYARLAQLAAEIMARGLVRPDHTCLLPIPLGRKRLRARGYNQAEEIAGALSRLWSCPVDSESLRRMRETKTQTALTPEGRVANVAGAFEASPPPSRVRHARIMLIDDVLTTGATLAAAAAALQHSGWRDIGAITFARALPFAIRVNAA